MTTRDDIERLFRTHYAAMYRLAMLILRDDDVSRDIVHDVFEALLVSDRADVSGAYLLAAVRNRCLKHIRSLSTLDRMKAVYSVDESEIADEDWPDDETIALIQSTVSNDLSDTCRRVVDLRGSGILRHLTCGCLLPLPTHLDMVRKSTDMTNCRRFRILSRHGLMNLTDWIPILFLDSLNRSR